MNKISDFLPKGSELNKKTTYTSLEKGTVLRMFVDDTDPPKIKRFIVLGLHENKIALGTLFINSDLNKNINYSTELQSLQYELKSQDNTFLTHDSFVDCSTIQQRENEDVLKKVNEDNSKIIGYLNPDTFEDIRKTVIKSETIRGKHKKRFGLYD
ncbi:hypothetical protein MK851_00885 [Tenacibaculum sp. 1B UA]|uniref:hypothetical protein n=1 Tax=Tenacibaculum sp. 1B UA TaxID=2922252 RepID=UPI002A24B92D|nr:hypothetical protein [Tenacibaculum sp. 1B UA]MDX8552181.1 hypothetical protein [Tenacibaculum sp. 1B UA]